jgi:5'-nucleotidase
MTQKILYIDMNSTLVDFSAGLPQMDPSVLAAYGGNEDKILGLLALMPPTLGALDACGELSHLFDTYILSTAPWKNPSAWLHKIEWVHLHLGIDEGSPAYKRLILSRHKDLNRGDFLVDDRPTKNGADRFKGGIIHFGEDPFRTWPDVVAHLRGQA